MTDKEWLKSELARTGMSRGALARAAKVDYNRVHRAFVGEEAALTTEHRELIKCVLDRAPNASLRDYDALIKTLRETGLTASMIRNRAGVARGAVINLMSGALKNPSVYDRLAAWVNAGMPIPPRVNKTRATEPPSPSLRGNIARTLAIIEGRAGTAPETSLGSGYTTSSVLPSFKHYDMPARNRANKYIQRIDG